MRALGIVLLAGCVVLTHVQMAVWRSPVALWAHVAAVSPALPRPALNYGVALLDTDRRGAVLWMVRAGELAEGHPREAEIRAVIRQRLMVLEAFGDPVCSRPLVSSFC